MAGSKATVYAALIGNIAVAVTKLAAAALTGSSAMLSEAVHSVVDSGNELLLLYGMRQARRRPDAVHPLGYGRELYFWSFIVALLLFAVGAGVSIVQGIAHIRHPEPVEDVTIVYIVLGLSLLFEGASWCVAARGFARAKGELGWWRAIRVSKDPPQFMVLLEDTAAIAGIFIALVGTWAAQHLNDPRIDGAASIAIGLLLGIVATVLARESKGLLIGERGDAALVAAAASLAKDVPGIVGVNGVLTMQLAPDQVVVALSLKFDDRLATPEIERLVEDMESRLRATRPELHLLFVKPQTGASYALARSRFLAGGSDTPPDA